MRPGGERDRNYLRSGRHQSSQRPGRPGRKNVPHRPLAAGRRPGMPRAVKPASLRPRLAEPAVQALLAIRAPGTDKVLLKALGHSETSNACRFSGRSASCGVRKPSAGSSPSPRARTRISAKPPWFALAGIGDPRTEFLLSRIDIASSPRERATAASRYLLFAQRLFENGRKRHSLRIGRSLLSKCTGPGNPRSGARP